MKNINTSKLIISDKGTKLPKNFCTNVQKNLEFHSEGGKFKHIFISKCPYRKDFAYLVRQFASESSRTRQVFDK
jgi:hypothetical protein